MKHALGIADTEIARALFDADIAHGDIDFIAITSTQSVELLTGLIDQFTICIEPHPDDETPSTLVEALGISPERIKPLQRHSVRPALTDDGEEFATTLFEVSFRKVSAPTGTDLAAVGWLDNYATARNWSPEVGMDALAARPAQTDDAMRYGFHLPVTIDWHGRQVPGCFVQHHMAHGAACYYRSGFENAAVLTHDGFLSGNSYHSGLNFYGNGHRLWPVSPNHLTLGMVYNFAAEMTGLGLVHGAGKLMGLAPYGQPVLLR